MSFTFTTAYRPIAPRWFMYLRYLLTRRAIYKPLYRADVVSFDLLGQAKHLREAGYYVASAMLLRTHLESSIVRLGLITPNWKESKDLTFSSRLMRLQEDNVIDESTKRAIYDVYRMLSKITHGGTTTPKATWQLFCQMNGIRKQLEEAAAIALGRTI